MMWRLAKGGGITAACLVCTYRWQLDGGRWDLMMTLMRSLPGETAHFLCTNALKFRLTTVCKTKWFEELGLDFCGIPVESPVGLAAGIDRNGTLYRRLWKLGYAHVEVGSVTPEPQGWSGRTSFFHDRHVEENIGCPSPGVHFVAKNMVDPQSDVESRPPYRAVGVNAAPNSWNCKTATGVAKDLATVIDVIGGRADWITLNLSTASLGLPRHCKDAQSLHTILTACVEARENLPHYKPPLFVKIPSGLDDESLRTVAIAALAFKIGLVVGGGLPTGDSGTAISGVPLRETTRSTVSKLARFTAGQVVIVASGGIFGPKDTFNLVKAGASMVQLYSALPMYGPGSAQRINNGLKSLMNQHQMPHLIHALGKDHYREPERPAPRPWWKIW